VLGLHVFGLGFKGLALADSAKQFTHAAILFVLLWRWQGGLAGFGLGRLAVKVAIASVVCAAVCIMALHLYHDGMHGLKLMAFVLVSGSVGLVAYFGALLVLRTEEMGIVVGRLQARLRRS
jgi:hypothetical protein